MVELTGGDGCERSPAAGFSIGEADCEPESRGASDSGLIDSWTRSLFVSFTRGETDAFALGRETGNGSGNVSNGNLAFS